VLGDNKELFLKLNKREALEMSSVQC
jgi:hypothetical protein